MRVPVDQHILGILLEERLRRWAAHFVAMAHTDPEPAALSPDPVAQPRMACRVGVAEHRFHWRDGRELVENLVASDIARVQDQIDASERVVDIGPQQTVRVGDEADQNRLILLGSPRFPIA